MTKKADTPQTTKRCWSSAFPPSAPTDEVTEAGEVYINAGEKGQRHPDPAELLRRRANKRAGTAPGTETACPSRGWSGAPAAKCGWPCWNTVARRNYAVWARRRVRSGASSIRMNGAGIIGSPPAAGSIRRCTTRQGYENGRDDDGDGVREVHVNTIEGLWTDLRNFIRPLRGLNKAYLSQYLAVFEWAHNLKEVIPDLIRMMLWAFAPKPT